MYKYTFNLSNGQRDQLVSETFLSALQNYFQWRGTDILDGIVLEGVEITPYPPIDIEPYMVKQELIEKIVKTLKSQNTKTEEQIQQERCLDMKKTCPEGSKEFAPIMQYEDWCDDVPYQEFVKNNKYLSQCYRLTNLIQAFVSGLEAMKGGVPMPQWPTDPFSKNAIPKKELQRLYEQAKEADIEIPPVFEKFINLLDSGAINIKEAMKGQYIGFTDRINPKYMTGFVDPVVEAIFPKQTTSESGPIAPTQEEQDLQLAMQLAQQLGHQ